MPGSYDAIICLDNSFTRLFTHAERRHSLAEYHRLLRPGSILVLGQRNYDGAARASTSILHVYYMLRAAAATSWCAPNTWTRA